MAVTEKKRVNYKRERTDTYQGYEDGSAVRKPKELPQEHREEHIRKNRRHAEAGRKAKSLTGSFVVFLTLACVAVSVLCVLHLRQKATITNQYEKIAELESEYSRLKNDNDARYNKVLGSVSMEDVKNAAETRLGMHYANEDQIMYYDLTDGGYVRQYKDVPEK